MQILRMRKTWEDLTVNERTMRGKVLVHGSVTAPLLYSDTGVSFLGGVDTSTGIVIDTHHPLCGQGISGHAVAIPSGRGSCAGSLALFELLMNGHAPSALIFCEKETILTLGAIIAAEFFGVGIPVLQISNPQFDALSDGGFVSIDGDRLLISQAPMTIKEPTVTLEDVKAASVSLEPIDESILAGEHGEAARLALRIILRAAEIEGTQALVDIDMAHIDGCFYQGPGTLQFAEKLLELNARVKVPSTMNALCVDRRKWKMQGVEPEVGRGSEALADAYEAMGVKPTYTCAPYLLDPAPRFGQQIAWAESNAAVYANSVLGARTMKYPDYLDILVAITGRAPFADCHRADARHAQIIIDLPQLSTLSDSLFPLLGYLVGQISPNTIPLVAGLEQKPVSLDDMKAFGAAFATTSAVAMFHILGHTPEAKDLDSVPKNVPRRQISYKELVAAWREINPGERRRVQLVSLGNPHFSLTECEQLARLCANRQKSPDVDLIVTCGRDVHEKATKTGYVQAVEAFGGRFISDTCWCLIRMPVINPRVDAIVTNSGKYAHYGPAVLGKPVFLAGMAECIEGACSGSVNLAAPDWL
jgi:predicted aconitase/predicted aconitase with swiveling domain